MGDRRRKSRPSFSDRFCIVLVEPQHDGNIGAVARSMMNFGFSDLRVVGRVGEWSEEARRRAKNSQEVLDKALRVSSMKEAVSDCSVVVGTSGKREDGEKTSSRHFLLPDELPDRLSNTQGKVALVFGPEGKGLLNNQLRLCDLLVTIPSWEGYPILNLSHAVAIICYSWYTNSENSQPSGTGGRLLDPQLRRRLKTEIARLVESLPTREHKRKGIEETLTRVIMRGLPKNDEIHRIIGVISMSSEALSED
tara:strand:+ start:785 stop:1537 length:753 start_codon:yes stop_codon:yes gene_type:complete